MFYQYTKINIKKILEYKMDFFIGAMPHFVGQIANIAFFKIIIGGVARIQNWEINEVMLVFSFSTLIYGMHALLFGNFRSLKRYLFTGQFEIMRIRPIHIVRHLMIVDFRSESIEQIFLGSILLVYSATQLTVEINFRNILTALYFVACGAAVLGGLSLCTTPHLDEETIRQLFIKALNTINREKTRILAGFEEIRDTAFETGELEAEERQLNGEMNVAAELIQKCIEENARVAQNQGEYVKRYDALVGRFETAKARLEEVQAAITEKQAQRKMMENFMEVLRGLPEQVDYFDEGAWYAMVDFVTVYGKEDVRFTFKNGMEIPVKTK